MRLLHLTWCILPGVCAVMHGAARNSDSNLTDYGRIPLYFEENRGQTDSRALFLARGSGITTFVRRDGLTLSMKDSAISMKILGANRTARMSAEGRQEGVSNFYSGSRSITAVPHFASVRAKRILPGIDVIYHGDGRQFEYDFVVSAGTSIRDLRLRFEGADKPTIASNGDLILISGAGELRQHMPKAWQDSAHGRRMVDCGYRVSATGEVSFELGPHDRLLPLTIDPILSYSSYLGGSSSQDEMITAVTVDSSGYAYVTGYTAAADFPVTSGTLKGGYDAFVAKMNLNGTGVIYSTFIGGNSSDRGLAIAVDGSGYAYVTGESYSTNFPTTSGSAPSGLLDAFVTKLSPAGALAYSRLLGGNQTDTGSGIAVDNSGAAYVTGTTYSTDFPTVAGALRTTSAGAGDMFVVKLNATGTTLLYSTYLGGSLDESASAISVDPVSGVAYLVGSTYSTNFPSTATAYQKTYSGGQDGFVAVLSASGGTLSYATYLGGTAADIVNGVAVDSSGNIYLAGTTSSTDFPTTAGAFSTSKNQYNLDAFVTKLNAAGSLVYSTFAGGSDYETAAGIAVDSLGHAYVAGITSSYNFPTTPGAIKSTRINQYGDYDAFVFKLSPAGDTISYSTLLGSSGYEIAKGLALDSNGGLYIVGATPSSAFPTTPNAFQSVKSAGSYNTGFISKIDMSSPTTCSAAISPSSVNMPGRGGNTSFTLSLAAGCPWEAVADSGLTISGPTHGMGNASPIQFNVAVALNNATYSGQTLLVRFGSATFTVNQAAGSCLDPVITPTSATFDMLGGIRTISLSMPYSCSWSASSNANWLSIASSQTGNGSASLTIFASPNDFSQRTGTITLARQSVTITQTGGTCTGSSTAVPLAFGSQGGTGTARINTSGLTCRWQAYSLVPWIQINPTYASGQGSTNLPFVVAANPGTVSRTGQIALGEQTLTITQASGPSGTIGSYSMSTFAGSGAYGSTGDGGPATDAAFTNPSGLAFEPSTRKLYIADAGAGRIRVVTPDGNIDTFAGGGASTGENIPATTAVLNSPASVAVDSTGAVYIGESARVRKVFQGNIATFAGTGTSGGTGDNGPATAATLNGVSGLVADTSNNLYIADYANNRVRKVTSGTITAFAGTGSSSGPLGDNGSALLATLRPVSVTMDGAGNVYTADASNSRVRKIVQGNPAIISTVAGGGTSGLEGVAALTATLSVSKVAIDGAGNLFLSDSNRVRKVGLDGVINTITPAQSGFYINGIATDSAGNVYFSDYYSYVIRKLTPVASFCSFTVPAPANQAFGGGSAPLSVSAGAGCSWTAVSDISWITISSGASGTGNGAVTLTIAANNASSPRTGTILVAGQALTITQNGRGSATPHDVRGIGVSDVALYSPASGDEYTALSDSAGGFTYVYTPYSAGLDTLRFGDWNGDGKADMVIYNSVTALAYVGMGNGTGQFNFGSLFWSPGFNRVATGDLNGDGLTDFVLYRTSDGTMYTALSNGDGTFRYQYTLVSIGFTHVVVADFNGDGSSDIFLYRKSDGVGFLGISNGTGGFAFSPVNSIGSGSDFVESGDINGDGKTDLAFYSSTTGVAKTAISFGTGFSVAAQTWSSGFTTFRMLDFNGDGKADIALYNKNNTLGYLGIGNGAGAFPTSSLFWGAGMDNVEILDLNGDGKMDVLIYNSQNGASYSGLSTGNPSNPFIYKYAYWGNNKLIAK